MRPKIVVVTLVGAFAVLGLIALLKGVAGKNAGAGGETTSTTGAAADAQAASTNSQPTALSGHAGNPAVSAEMRAAVIAKAIEEIQDIQAQANGTNNPEIIAALLAKLTHPEPEVRKAALQAIKELNDTNAVPGLQQVANATKEPREKVAVLDVIDYLNLPSAVPDQPLDYYTNLVTHHDHQVRQAHTNGTVHASRDLPATSPSAKPALPQ